MTTPRRKDQRVINVTLSAERYAALKDNARSISMSLTGIVNSLIGSYLANLDASGGANLATRVESLESKIAVLQAELKPRRAARAARLKERRIRDEAKRVATRKSAILDALDAPNAPATVPANLFTASTSDALDALQTPATPAIVATAPAPSATETPTFARKPEPRPAPNSPPSTNPRPVERAARVSNDTGVALASTFPQRPNETASDRAIRYALRRPARDIVAFY